MLKIFFAGKHGRADFCLGEEKEKNNERNEVISRGVISRANQEEERRKEEKGERGEKKLAERERERKRLGLIRKRDGYAAGFARTGRGPVRLRKRANQTTNHQACRPRGTASTDQIL